jgi:hypothetical protein
MATLLGTNLSMEKRLLLGQLSQAAGWLILKGMMEEMCMEATKKVMKADPEEEKYPAVLQRLQLEARAMNDFSLSLIKSVEEQVKVGNYQYDKQNPAEKIMREKNQADDLNIE